MTPVAVIGCGAVGGTFAGAARQAGREIHVATRTPFDELCVTHPGGLVRVGVRALRDPSPAGPYPLVLLATKAHQTADAAPWLRALCGKGTVLGVLQNGVEQRELVAPFVGEGVHVVPAMVDCPAHREGPGVVTVRGAARVEFPPVPGAAELVACFAGSFADARVADDFVTSAWAKLVLNAAGGGLGVLTRRGHEVLRDEAIAALFVAIAREIVTVGRAEGARLADDLPQVLLEKLRRAPSPHPSSIVADRLAGRPTEWRARNEVVLRAAARHGIAVPYNTALVALVRAGEPGVTSGTDC